jgi:hypothetical protein
LGAVASGMAVRVSPSTVSFQEFLALFPVKTAVQHMKMHKNLVVHERKHDIIPQEMTDAFT